MSLHYLREGRVFVFGVQDSVECESAEGSRLEHYWLCAACAQVYGLAQDKNGIRMVPRRTRQRAVGAELPKPRLLAG